MTSQSANQQVFRKVIGSAALGALAMYVMDPDKGRRRRAIARDKARRMLANTSDMMGTAARDVRFRMQGLRARARRLMRRREVPEDLVLIERVRTKLGRVCSHPHAIQVGVNHGRVTLSGPVLASEAQRLLEAAHTTWGVREVEDRLVVYPRPEFVSSLQGGVPRRERRLELFQENWTPSLRVAAMLGGGLLALAGARRRGASGLALVMLGMSLAARGATNVPITRLAGVAQGRRVIDLQKTIHVEAPPEDVYDLWNECGNLPRFMTNVDEVRDLGGGRTHWVMKGPDGLTAHWDAIMSEATRPQRLSWHTEDGAGVQHACTVDFEPSNGGTQLAVRMTYSAAGALGHVLTSLLGRNPKRQMDDDLAHMKAYVESRVPPADAGARDKPGGQALH